MGIFSNILGGSGSIAGDAINGFLNFVLKPSMSISDIANVYSSKLDEIILSEDNSKLTYVGGNFKLSYINDRFFGLSYELFFQDNKKEWIKKSAESKPQSMNYLSKESQAELRKERYISFEIDPPNIKEDIKGAEGIEVIEVTEDTKGKVIRMSDIKRK